MSPRYTCPLFILLSVCVLTACEKKSDWKNDFSGDWQSSTGNGYFHEVWEEKEGLMVGRGFEIDSTGDTSFSERLQLEERGETLVYTAWPGGQRMVEFVGKMNETGRYVFENKHNDFPSVIEYVFQEKGVEITLRGTQGGDATTDVYKLSRQNK